MVSRRVIKTLQLDVVPYLDGCRLIKADYPTKYKQVMCELIRMQRLNIEMSLIRVEADCICFMLPELIGLEQGNEYTMQWRLYA